MNNRRFKMISGELYIEENGSYLRVEGGVGVHDKPHYANLWRIPEKEQIANKIIEIFGGREVCEESPKIDKTVDGVIELVEKPKKRKKRSGRTTEFLKVRPLVLERDGFRCTKCGCTDNLHVHHIVEKSKGGSNALDNLITLCKECHAEEHKDEPVYKIMVL